MGCGASSPCRGAQNTSASELRICTPHRPPASAALAPQQDVADPPTSIENEARGGRSLEADSTTVIIVHESICRNDAPPVVEQTAPQIQPQFTACFQTGHFQSESLVVSELHVSREFDPPFSSAIPVTGGNSRSSSSTAPLTCDVAEVVRGGLPQFREVGELKSSQSSDSSKGTLPRHVHNHRAVLPAQEISDEFLISGPPLPQFRTTTARALDPSGSSASLDSGAVELDSAILKTVFE